MAEPLTIDFSKPVPLFPLPGCALLPHATAPLHIFEPRYRRMVRDALADRKLIALATFSGEDWKQDYMGAPPLRPVVCVGYVARHERLPDGRYNMLLQGLCRAKIIREEPHDPYRAAVLEPTEAQVLEIDLTEERQRLESLLADPLLRELAAVSALRNWLSTEVPTAALIDLAVMALCDDSEHRYLMLAESRVGSRGRWLRDLLTGTRHTLAIARRFGTGQSPEGWPLN